MAYINLTGDSNGDLHTAEMHNAKFGAISSVINGNIDLENLTNPKSIYVLNSSASGVGTSSGFVRAPALTDGGINATGPVSTASAFNVILGSVARIPVDSTFVAGYFAFNLQKNAGYGGETANLYLQASSAIGGTYSTSVASKTGVAFETASGAAPAFQWTEVTLTNAATALTAGTFIRFVIQNYPANAIDPPLCNLRLVLKANHLS
tara:strand:+ start:6673 stop:7293 length:621 start_codon:yes stop_codon:yes gene_type:complete